MIIGLSGTFSSGKDAAAQYLEDKYNFLHVSTGDILREDLSKQGKPLDRETMLSYANMLRSTEGIDVLVRRALLDHQEQDRLVITGIRNPGEVEAILNAGGSMVFVDAPIKLRYERARSRGRTDDNVSFETFVSHEKEELAGKDPASQQILKVKERATAIINNDGTLEDFYNKIDQVIRDL